MFFLTVFQSDCTKIMSGYILFVFIITDNYEQSMSIKEIQQVSKGVWKDFWQGEGVGKHAQKIDKLLSEEYNKPI